MLYRPLGQTSIHVSAVAFGAGPVPALLTGEDRRRQVEVVAAAIGAGINWFDTAPTYGDGASEESLGAALAELGANEVHVASKIRVNLQHDGNYREFVLATVRDSLRRLRVPRLALLQLHNAITERDGDLPSSVSAARVLAPHGILDALEAARREGLCSHLGLTGIGAPAALREVLESSRFAAAQIPFSIVQPSAGYPVRGTGIDDYDELFVDCRRCGVAALAIRVFAGGAVSGQPPSEHTKRTPYFPLAVFECDRRRADRIAAVLPQGLLIVEAAARFAAHHPAVTSAIIGMASTAQVRDTVRYVDAGPLSDGAIRAIMQAAAAD